MRDHQSYQSRLKSSEVSAVLLFSPLIVGLTLCGLSFFCDQAVLQWVKEHDWTLLKSIAGFLSKWGDGTGTNAFWMPGSRSRLACPEPSRLQDLVVHADRGDALRGDRELRPPAHRSGPTQQHGSNTRVERLMARPGIPAVQQPIPFISFGAHRRGICSLWRNFIR